MTADEQARSLRRPTVSGPRSPRAPRAAPAPRAASNMFAWLKREFVALLGMTGAAITVLAQLANVMPMARPLSRLLAQWQHVMHRLWRPPLDLAGIAVHPHIVAALNVALFMTMIGVGGRISAQLSQEPLAPIKAGRFFDDQTWPSLIVFVALCMVFLVGSDASPAENKLVLFGSKELGRYAFAILVTIGYFAGDFIGHRAFHLRLYRLAALVGVLVAINFAVLHFLNA